MDEEVIFCNILGLVITPFFTNAHVKWFTEVTPEKETIENIITPLFIL
ncbi:hypothetical protein [Bacillus sp. FSL K6-3431]